jgi:serine/threonine protein kinase
VRGETVDGRADIYALGCVLFEALSGDVPFPREEIHAVYYAHLNTEPPCCSEMNTLVPPAFDPVISCALSKDPADRFAAASDFAAACREALAASVEIAVESAPDSLPPQSVLVLQSVGEEARIHFDVECAQLAGIIIPPPVIRFAGPGTAGWMPPDEALRLTHASNCTDCVKATTGAA